MPENTNPLTKERHALILARLRQDGRVLATELAVEFGISEDSVRRDLRQMAAAGLCERVYGGALPPAPPAAPLQDRIRAMPDRTAMAVAMVGLIDEGDVVFIDAGSTNVAIAANLPASLSATIVTNAPAVASAVPADCLVRIVLIGGLLDRQSGACVGQSTLRDLQNLRPDLLILGACGLDVEAGVTAFGYEEAEIKRLAASRSRRIAVAATVNKIGTAAAYCVAPVERLSTLVVEAGCPDALVSPFRDRGVEIIAAGGDGRVKAGGRAPSRSELLAERE